MYIDAVYAKKTKLFAAVTIKIGTLDITAGKKVKCMVCAVSMCRFYSTPF